MVPAKPPEKRGLFSIFLIIIALSLFGLPSAVTAQDRLSVALVQFSVEEDLYTSLARFRRHIHRLVERSSEEFGAEVVVFPEYVNIFSLLRDYDIAVDEADGFDELLAKLTATESLHTVLSREIAETVPALRQMWSEIAAEEDVWIVAGSAFVHGPDGGVRNRAWVFGPDGSLVYRQDKVFLTPEEALLSVTPGQIAAAQPFTIDGVTFGLTVCRDGFFDSWEEIFKDVDVWLEIRANGERWTDEVAQRFQTAMPERVREAGVQLGLTTSLTGQFLDLLWQGPTGVVDGKGEPLFQSSIVDGTAIYVISVM